MRTIIGKSFKAALDENDILISPAAPSAAYKIGILILLYFSFSYFACLLISFFFLLCACEWEGGGLVMTLVLGSSFVVNNELLSCF